jgi:hypothetical protein
MKLLKHSQLALVMALGLSSVFSGSMLATQTASTSPKDDEFGALVTATEQLSLGQQQDAYAILLSALQKARVKDLDLVPNWNELIEYCHQITSLTFSEENISSEELALIVQHCPKLISLVFLACEGIADDGLKAIAQHCPNLRKLKFNYCPDITNTGLQPIAQRCPNLKDFKFSNCPGITDAGQEAFESDLKALTAKALDACPDTTSKPYKSLLGALQKSEGLNNLALVLDWNELVDHCHQITSLAFSCKNITN